MYIHPGKINKLKLKIKENLIGKRVISENSELLGRVGNSFNTSIWKSKVEADRCLKSSRSARVKSEALTQNKPTKPPMTFEDSSRKQKQQHRKVKAGYGKALPPSQPRLLPRI